MHKGGEMAAHVDTSSIARIDESITRVLAAEQAARALERHGLHGLQVYPPAVARYRLLTTSQALLGVMTLAVRASGELDGVAAVNPSPEAEACRVAYCKVAIRLAELAAVSTTLARLLAEYRRTVRRVRALQDVLLPELDADIADIDTRLEDLEREDAIAVRIGR